jgi:endo-1,4-beta-xylanase
MNKFVVSGLIAFAILAATVYAQTSSEPKPDAATPAATAPATAAPVASEPAAAPKTDAVPTATQPAAADSNIKGMKDAYAGKFLIGTAGDLGGRYSAAEYENIKANYDIATPENCMKPQPIHPSENNYNWTAPDAMVKWCQDNNVKVWGHTLAWHSQTAPWFFNAGADGVAPTREVGMERLKKHITDVVGRYKGRIVGWDVVNEAINDGGGGNAESENLRSSPWIRLIGPDYLTMAFKWAHEADPESQLYYNDYNIEQGAVQNRGKHANSLALLKRLIKDGAPINGVGIQGHWHLDTNIADVEKAIENYEALGLKISISELDVTATGTNSGALGGGGRGGAVSEDSFKRQADVYAKLFDIFNRHAKSMSRVTFWGISDSRSWRSGQSPLVFTSQLQPKPAYQAIIDVGLGKKIEAKP